MKRIRRNKRRNREEDGRVFKEPPRFLRKSVHVQTKLTEQIASDICDFVFMGAPYDVAAEAIGINSSTEANWRRLGMAYIQDIQEDGAAESPDNQIFAEYAQAVITARAKWQMRILQRSFQDSFRSTWIRDLALLERRDPNNWRIRNEDVLNEQDVYEADETFL